MGESGFGVRIDVVGMESAGHDIIFPSDYMNTMLKP